jgi:hypothetical protein
VPVRDPAQGDGGKEESREWDGVRQELKLDTRSYVLSAIRQQSALENRPLTAAQWKLLNDSEESPLTSAEIGDLLERIDEEDDEDDVVDLLSNFRAGLSPDDRLTFDSALAEVARRNEYLGSLVEDVSWEPPKPPLPRWVDRTLLLLTGSAIVGALVAGILIALAHPEWAPNWPEPKLLRELKGRLNDVYGPWQSLVGRAFLFGVVGYAAYFFIRELWRRIDRS